MATLMLEGGADIRYIQHMLGHSCLETTSIYTQVSIQKLMEVYMRSHPGAKLERKKPKQEVFEKAAERLAAEQELFSALTAEAKDEEPKKRKRKSGSARTGNPTGSASETSDHAKPGGSGPAHRLREKGGKTAGRTAR